MLCDQLLTVIDFWKKLHIVLARCSVVHDLSRPWPTSADVSPGPPRCVLTGVSTQREEQDPELRMQIRRVVVKRNLAKDPGG